MSCGFFGEIPGAVLHRESDPPGSVPLELAPRQFHLLFGADARETTVQGVAGIVDEIQDDLSQLTRLTADRGQRAGNVDVHLDAVLNQSRPG